MIVSELIELLKKEDPDSPVLRDCVFRTGGQYLTVKKIIRSRVKKNSAHTGKAYDYSGEYKEASIMDKKTDDEVMGVKII